MNDAHILVSQHKMVHISLEQRHIEAGKRNQGASHYDPRCDCPVALAVAESLGEQVMISQHQLFVGPDAVCLPAKVKDFIAQFDNNQLVAPFTFELDEV